MFQIEDVVTSYICSAYFVNKSLCSMSRKFEKIRLFLHVYRYLIKKDDFCKTEVLLSLQFILETIFLECSKLKSPKHNNI